MISGLSVALLLTASAAAGHEGYMEPDQVLVDIVDAEWAPWASISPDFSAWLFRTPRRNPPISELALEELRLAGMRFRAATGVPTNSMVLTELSLMTWPDLEHRPVQGLPDDPRILSTTWSPDGSMIAFTNETGEGVELWLIDVFSAEASRLTGPVISLAANEWPEWLPTGEGLLCCLIPEDRTLPPEEDPVPDGPVVLVADGSVAPARTYTDLLENTFDEALFEYYMTSQPAVIGTDGSVTSLGESGMIWYYSSSPDARYILMSSLKRPFSYSVTAGRFSEEISVLDRNGEPVREIADHPVRDRIPIAVGSVHQGPRSIHWRSDAPATLCWVEAMDGGDAGSEAELRDRVLLLEAPFDGEPKVWIELESRFSDIVWGNDSLAIITEWWWPTRNIRSWRVRPGYPFSPPQLLIDRSWEDIYGDPGEPVTRRNRSGREVLFTSPDGGSIYLKGDGASPEGDMPFLDMLELSTLDTERLFLSTPPFYERPVMFTDTTGNSLLIRRESVTDYPDYFVIDLTSGGEIRVTDSPHPTPGLADISKELITYEREDGIPLSATLYLPPGYEEGDGPLPMIMWAYPQEFVSSSAAGQISGSPYEFDYIGWWSPLIWLTRGYAILDDPAMPIVASGDALPNDTFVEQLVMSAEAAVDEVVRMGVADPDRIAVGGHSYGAFMTANLLAHTDLFAAGLARTGAYNRTLTPFGFQSEDRSLWDAPEVYIGMSPFMYADGVNEPLLLIHGDSDSNSGTFPIQSERFFAAIRGLGGVARLVMLPLEDHSYRARESILHVLWETQEWLDTYVSEPPDPR